MLATALTWMVLAQPVPGVWTGYVNGWQPSNAAAPTVRPAPHGVRRVAPVVAVPVPFYAPRVEERHDESRAELARLEAQQAALQAQQQAFQAQLLAEQQRAAAEQQRAADAQQRLLAEQRRQVELERVRLEEERAAAALRREQEQRERELAAREAARQEEARHATPGPDIHRWVDDEGVVHYSTRARR